MEEHEGMPYLLLWRMITLVHRVSRDGMEMTRLGEGDEERTGIAWCSLLRAATLAMRK